MKTEKKEKKQRNTPANPACSTRPDQARMVLPEDDEHCLDTVQLHGLEQAFRVWAQDSTRKDVRYARTRILMIFLLIRNTGAKLSEVLSLNPFEDIDFEHHALMMSSPHTPAGSRSVPLSEDLSGEIKTVLFDPDFRDQFTDGFNVDPAFVRRKFYERAEACGFPKQLGGPEMIRKARAVELLRGNMPLPAVQNLLGHARPNQTSSYVQFSPDEIHQATRVYIERESSRKTSARNAFFCKISRVVTGDIQARLDLVTVEDQALTTVITTDSLRALGLSKGSLVTAEVKAPWIDLCKGESEPLSSAENRFRGIITGIKKGTVNTEYQIRVSPRTALCAIVSSEAEHRLDLKEGDDVWALFNCFSVVLHRD